MEFGQFFVSGTNFCLHAVTNVIFSIDFLTNGLQNHGQPYERANYWIKRYQCWDKWSNWQSSIISIKFKWLYTVKITWVYSQWVFKCRARGYYQCAGRKAWAKVPLYLDTYKTPNQHYFKRFLIRSVSNWSKDSSKPKFRVISSDDMDSNDLWGIRGTIQPLVYFGRVIIRPPLWSYSSFLLPSYRIFRYLNLKNLSQAYNMPNHMPYGDQGSSKAPEDRIAI